MNWDILLYGLLTIVAIWMIRRLYQTQPQAFSKDNLNKSGVTLAYLSLALIGFVVICVMLLRQN
jgi:hypothetical protein